MSPIIYLLLLLLLLPLQSQQMEESNEHQVTYLQVGRTHTRDELSLLQSWYTPNMVHIYCRRDQRLRWSNIFQSNRLQLWIARSKDPQALEYKQYRASTPRGVQRAHAEEEECHEGKLLACRTREMRTVTLPAHAHACYGIYTDRAYNLTLLQVSCDKERVVRFGLGLLIWATSPWLWQSLISCYVLALVLGVYSTAFGLVCAALLAAGDHQLQALRPLGGNFKLLLEQYPSAVILALIAGAWLSLRTCQNNKRLWSYRFVRLAYYRFLRFIAYILIFSASDNRSFGIFCLVLLLPWPELWWFLRWFRLQCVKMQRCVLPPTARRYMSSEEFQVQSNFETQRALSDLRQRLQAIPPRWEHMAQLYEPHRFARFISSGNLHQLEREREPVPVPEPVPLPVPEPRPEPEPVATSSQEVQTMPEDNAHSVLEQLAVAINSGHSNNAPTYSSSSSSTSSSSTGRNIDDSSSSTIASLYRNPHFQGSTRSLRHSPRRK